MRPLTESLERISRMLAVPFSVIVGVSPTFTWSCRRHRQLLQLSLERGVRDVVSVDYLIRDEHLRCCLAVLVGAARVEAHEQEARLRAVLIADHEARQRVATCDERGSVRVRLLDRFLDVRTRGVLEVALVPVGRDSGVSGG